MAHKILETFQRVDPPERIVFITPGLDGFRQTLQSSLSNAGAIVLPKGQDIARRNKKEKLLILTTTKSTESVHHLEQILDTIERLNPTSVRFLFPSTECQSAISAFCEKLAMTAKITTPITFDTFELGLCQLTRNTFEARHRDLFKQSEEFFPMRMAHMVDIALELGVGRETEISAKGGDALTLARKLDSQRRTDRVCIGAHFVVISRDIDYITPMLTQLTFEGILSEKEHGHDLLAEDFKLNDGNLQDTLPQQDPVLELLRTANISQVARLLHDVTMDVKRLYDTRNVGGTVDELREFVSQFKNKQKVHRQLEKHARTVASMSFAVSGERFAERVAVEQDMVLQTNIASAVEYIEGFVWRTCDMISALRLACLLSHCTFGLTTVQHERLMNAIADMCGIPLTIVAFHELERRGLLKKQKQQISLTEPYFTAPSDGLTAKLRQTCRLWVENLDERNPNDLAYAYSGYAPVLLRAIEAIIEKNKEILHQIPGSYFHFPGSQNRLIQRVVVVVMGGITSAECNALQYILGAKLAQDGQGLILVADDITTGNMMIRQAIEAVLQA